MAKKICAVCGNSIGALASKFTIVDGLLCGNCWNKAGMRVLDNKMYNSATIKEMIAIRERNQPLIDNFNPTAKLSKLLFDDNSQSFIIAIPFQPQELYYYNQIVDFELLEDGETITKGGLGRAVAGGLLLGGAGAIVGGVTGGKKSKSVCTSLKIKITLRNSPRQTEYLSFISSPTKTNSRNYRLEYKSAQDTLSALQLAVDKVANTPGETPAAQQAVSGADEILKYKNLMDAGIITEEEFKAKKAQILGL